MHAAESEGFTALPPIPSIRPAIPSTPGIYEDGELKPAPTGVVVYDADKFPQEFRGNVLTALYWHGQPGSRYRQITRTFQTEEEGKKVWKTLSFIEGLDRPTAMAVGPDGALYVADMRGGKADPDVPGAIYRVTYEGK